MNLAEKKLTVGDAGDFPESDRAGGGRTRPLMWRPVKSVTPATPEAKAEALSIQCLPGLPGDFRANLGNSGRFCLKVKSAKRVVG